jgi:hypothetical protein
MRFPLDQLRNAVVTHTTKTETGEKEMPITKLQEKALDSFAAIHGKSFKRILGNVWKDCASIIAASSGDTVKATALVSARYETASAYGLRLELEELRKSGFQLVGFQPEKDAKRICPADWRKVVEKLDEVGAPIRELTARVEEARAAFKKIESDLLENLRASWSREEIFEAYRETVVEEAEEIEAKQTA